MLSGAEPVHKRAGEVGFTSPLARGRWVASGTFSTGFTKRYNYSSASEGDYRYPATSVSLAAGTFVQDRLLVGAEVYAGLQGAALDISSATVGYSGRNPVLVGIRPYVRRYVGSVRLAPYIQGSLAYDRIMAGSRPTNTFYAGGNIGLVYVLGQNLLVEASLVGLSGGYSMLGNIKSEIATILSSSKFFVDLEAGLQPAFTLTYVFR